MHQFLKFIFGIKLCMFRTVALSIISSFALYTQQWYMSYRFADSLRTKSVWHVPLLCVQWKTADDGQRKCPKHVEFYSKNKFEKLVHLVGLLYYYKKLSRCTVTWTWNSYYETLAGGGGALEFYERCRDYPPILQTSNLQFCMSGLHVFLILTPKPCCLINGQAYQLFEEKYFLLCQRLISPRSLTPWQWRQYFFFPPKCCYLSTNAHVVTSHKPQ